MTLLGGPKVTIKLQNLRTPMSNPAELSMLLCLKTMGTLMHNMMLRWQNLPKSLSKKSKRSRQPSARKITTKDFVVLSCWRGCSWISHFHQWSWVRQAWSEFRSAAATMTLRGLLYIWLLYFGQWPVCRPFDSVGQYGFWSCDRWVLPNILSKVWFIGNTLLTTCWFILVPRRLNAGSQMSLFMDNIQSKSLV